MIPLPGRTALAPLGEQCLHGLEGLALHLQIDFDIGIGGFDGRVSEPGADHVEIDIGLEQVHGGGVAPGVRGDFSVEERGTHLDRLGDPVGHDVAQTKPRESRSLGIDEQGDGLIASDGPPLQIRPDGPEGFVPQRTGSLLATFAMDAHMTGPTEADVVDVQVHQLLCSHAGVVEQPVQGVVAATEWRLAIDLAEDFLHFLPFEISGDALGVTLEADGEDGVAMGKVPRIGVRQVIKERVDGRQTIVARGYGVVTVMFEIVQKASNHVRGQIPEFQAGAGFPATS